MNEIILRIKCKQLPILNELTELEYIYFSVGLFYYEEEKEKSLAELITNSYKEIFKMYEQTQYGIADIKTLLFDISCCVRGIGGLKKPFNAEDLPSSKAHRKINLEPENKTETEEERLERHKKFFAELKNSLK